METQMIKIPFSVEQQIVYKHIHGHRERKFQQFSNNDTAEVEY